MHQTIPFFGSIVNVIIIIVIIKFVMSVVKKSKATNQKGKTDPFEQFLGKESRSSTTPTENKPSQQQTGKPERTINMNPPVPNLKYENKLTDRDKLQLKRCSNCGGEIPLTMMKCTICGARQAGCSWIAVAIIMFVAMFFAMIASNESALPFVNYIKQLIGL